MHKTITATKCVPLFLHWPLVKITLSSMALMLSTPPCNTLHRIITHLVSSFLWFEARATNQRRMHQVHHHLPHSMVVLLVATNVFNIRQSSHCHAVGYSYARFVGPVSGPEQEILVRDQLNGGTRVDYVSRPEYQFAYGVEDAETQVLQNRKEERNGDAVKGVYSVVDPDGTLRVVKYTADNVNGFQAEVITNGVAMIHGQNNDGGGNWEVETGDVIHHDNGNDEKDNDGKNDYEVHEDYDENSDGDEKNASDEYGDEYGYGYDESSSKEPNKTDGESGYNEEEDNEDEEEEEEEGGGVEDY